MHCYGISNHSPKQAVDFLVKAKFVAAGKEIKVAEFGCTLPATPKKRVLFLVNIQDFYRNVKVLNSDAYKKVSVFVFASALRVREIKGCLPLDQESTQESPGVVVRLKPLSRAALRAGQKESRTDVKREDGKYLINMIESIKKGSLLAPLMTFIYTLPSSTHQTPVKYACAALLVEGQKFEDMVKALSKIGVSLNDRQRENLKTILSSEPAQKIGEYFKVAKAKKKEGGSVPVDQLCKKAGIDAYEVRYLTSAYEERNERGSVRGKSVAAMTREDAAARAERKKKEKDKAK